MQRGSYIKRGRGKAPNAVEKRHMDRIAAMGGLVTGGPATIHHVTSMIEGGRITRSHKLIVPLEPEFHLIQFGPRWSVEALGHAGFYRIHGIDLYAEAVRLWEESEQLERKAA